MKNYRIVRPPLNKSFELPSYKSLFEIKTGSIVKVMIQVEDDPVERMWVIVTDCSDDMNWSGTLDNDAVGEKTKIALPSGSKIDFHPLDIIAIHN